MDARPLTTDDIAAITELQHSFDEHWFGTGEHSEDEVREFVGWVDSLDDDTLLVTQDGRVDALAIKWAQDSAILVRPGVEGEPIYERLLPWFAERAANVEALNRDEQLLAALDAAGWTFRKSSFDLIRAVTDDLLIPEPTWPEGVEVTAFDAADAAAIHQLIYIDAGWAEVPGHPDRTFDEWRGYFVGEHTVPAQQVVVRRGDRMIGVAMGRMWDDGTGWVAQLATAKDERGRGVGRALLREALRRFVDAGATALGLSVQAANEGALRMYLEAGLQLDREWRQFAPPA